MMGIPKRFENASVYDWQEGHIFRRVMDEYLLNFAQYIDQGKAPVFLGNSGVGKSRAAAALLAAVDTCSSGRISTGWFSVSEAFNRLLDYKDMRIASGYTSIYSNMINTDVVVFDDFSTLRDSSRLKEYFWMVFENRYTGQKPTILTGNFYIGDNYDEEEFWKNMSLGFGTPFVRRLMEIGKTLIVLL